MNKSSTITIHNSINTGYHSHLMLTEFAARLSKMDSDEIYLDLSTVKFIAANQFAVLGCILHAYMHNHSGDKEYLSSLNNKETEVIQKNGFCRYLNLEKIPDKYNTTIPYRVFDISQIDEFEKYISLRVFNREGMPKMSDAIRDQMVDSILEIFNNVKEHTHSNKVFTCGQFFPKSSLLYLTIVDSGETIPYNVESYFVSLNSKPPMKALKWALVSGNTTRFSDAPGGLGLSFLDEFIASNDGRLYIVSGNETYERIKGKTSLKNLNVPFWGTIVTVAFNLSDSARKYYAASNNSVDIIF